MLPKRNNKVRRFQSGGPMLNLATYTPIGRPNVSGASASVEASASSSDNNLGITVKDVADLTKDMLYSDSKYVLGGMGNLLKMINMANYDPTFASQFGGQIANEYLSVRNLADTAHQNLKHYNNAKKKLMDKSALNEIAQDQEGNVYYLNEKGQIDKCNMSDIKDKRALSYADLLEYRRMNDGGAFANELINAAEMSTSTKDVIDTVNLIFDKLKNSTIENQYFIEKNGQGLSATGQAVQGLAEVMQDASAGLYEVTDRRVGLTDEKKKTALQTVLRMLPKNQLNFIKLRASMTDTNPVTMLYDMITLSENTVQSRHINQLRDYEEELTGGKGSGSGSDGKEYKMTNANWMLEGMGYKNIKVLNNGGKGNYAFVSLANTFQLPLEPDSKTGLVRINELTNPKYGLSGLNWNNASFAGSVIPYNDLNGFVVNGNYIDLVSLPYREDNTTGAKVPDFGRLDDLQNTSELLRSMNIQGVDETNYQQVNEALAKAGIDIQYDSKGNIITPGYAQFVAVSAAAGERTIENLTDVNSDMYTTLEDDSLAARIAEKTGVEASNNWIGQDVVMNGVIYVPFVPNPQLMLTGTESPIKVDIDTTTDKLVTQQARMNRPSYVPQNDVLSSQLYSGQ